MKISDKSVVKNLGFCGFGGASNSAWVDVKDGKVARIRPIHYDEQYTEEDLNAWRYDVRGHTFKPGMKTLLPPLALAYKKRAYSPNRVPYPLKRVDWEPGGDPEKINSQNRGTSPYKRISWDEATDIIASELVRIRRDYGPLSVMVQGEGHGETKIISGAHGCMSLLLDKLGDETPGNYLIQARQPDSWEGWYWGAKHVWGCETHGQQNPQDNVIWDISNNSDAVLFWGADPETTPWGWGGLQPSRLCYWFTELGIQHIHISPDVNYTNAIHADKWIPVRPNTDAALQLAIIYTWLTEDLYDKEYVATHVEGFDWLEWYVMGGSDNTPKTPKWAEEKCGVPSWRIKALARYWGTHKVSIAHCNGGSFVRAAFSHEPARLEVCLLGMQGLGKPGVNQLKFIEWVLQGINPVPPSKIYPSFMKIYHGWRMSAPKHFIPKTMTPAAIMNPPIDWYGHVVCYMKRDDQFLPFQYPEPGAERIHMIWSDTPCWETCWNGGTAYQDAMRDPSIEFYLVQHPWMENDTMMADIILPVSTLFELEDIGCDIFSGQWNKVTYEEQAVDHIGEALGDYEACLEIAKKLEPYGGEYENLYEKLCEGRHSFEEDARYGYENSGIPLDDYPFEMFQEKKWLAFPTEDGWKEKPAGFKPFADDPVNKHLKTPTGKLEFYSTGLAEHFPDDKIRAPYPQWIEEGDGHFDRITSDRAKDYPFLLVSNHPRWRVHAQCDDIPWLREIETCKVYGPDGYGYEPVWVHPDDAEKLGLKSGDIVKIFNERGAVMGGVRVTQRIMPGSLYQDHGARCDILEYGIGGLDRGGANNLIAPTKTSSKNAAGEVTSGFLVGIEKVDLDELAAKYPEAWNRDYDRACGLVAGARIVKED